MTFILLLLSEVKTSLQVRARAPGINEDETKSDAAKAIQSIPAYVENSTAFVALVPSVKGIAGLYDYTSWLARGLAFNTPKLAVRRAIRLVPGRVVVPLAVQQERHQRGDRAQQQGGGVYVLYIIDYM